MRNWVNIKREFSGEDLGLHRFMPDSFHWLGERPGADGLNSQLLAEFQARRAL